MSESNGVRIFLPLDLKLLIQEDGANTGQLSAQVILKIVTEHYKTRLNPEVYAKLNERYSMTAQESKHTKQLKKEEKARKRTVKDERKDKRSQLVKELREEEEKHGDSVKAKALRTELVSFMDEPTPSEPVEEAHKTGKIPRRR
jgi:hypothetical protein